MAHNSYSRFLSPGSEPADAALASPPANPAGMLYTVLRHGRGLSHEEADRMSCEFICGPSHDCQPFKTAA